MNLKKTLSMALAAAMAISCMSVTAFAEGTAFPSGWTTDRTAPKAFESTTYEGKSAYKLTTDAAGTTEEHHKYQGAHKALTNLAKGDWRVSTSLYVPLDLGDNEVDTTSFDTGIWLVINNTPTDEDTSTRIGYPLVGYRNVPESQQLGWYNFDDLGGGGWSKIDGLDGITTGWNDVLITCNENIVEIYINDTLVDTKEYTKDDDSAEDVYLTGIIFNSCNYGTEYTSYYATPVVGKYNQTNDETPVTPDDEHDIAQEEAREEAKEQVVETVTNVENVAEDIAEIVDSVSTTTGLDLVGNIPVAKTGTDAAKNLEAVCKAAGLEVAKVEVNGEVCVAPAIKLDVAKMGGNLPASINDMLVDSGIFLELKASDGKTYMIPTSLLTKTAKNRVYYPEAMLIALAVK